MRALLIYLFSAMTLSISSNAMALSIDVISENCIPPHNNSSCPTNNIFGQTAKEEAVGFQELIQHKDDASFKLKSGNDAIPMLVKEELFVSNEKLNKNLGALPFTIDDKFKEKYQQIPYVEQTKIKEILLQQGCKIINSFFVTSNVLDTPAVSYELSCPNGNVIVTENAFTKIQKNIQKYNNEIRLENNLVAGVTFYKNSQGMRNSYIITRNDKTQLRIMIIHGDNSQKDWLIKTANSAMSVD